MSARRSTFVRLNSSYRVVYPLRQRRKRSALGWSRLGEHDLQRLLSRDTPRVVNERWQLLMYPNDGESYTKKFTWAVDESNQWFEAG
jgi:hypothetical protein